MENSGLDAQGKKKKKGKRLMNLQCHWEFAANFQNVFVATRIFSLPSDPGSLSCTWAVHRMA